MQQRPSSETSYATIAELVARNAASRAANGDDRVEDLVKDVNQHIISITRVVHRSSS